MKTRINLINLSRSLALPSLIVVATASATFAQEGTTHTWTGAVNSDWNTASNWTPGIPAGAHNAGIQNGNTVQVSANPADTIDQLLVNGGSVLNLSAQLNVAGPTGNHGVYIGASSGAGTLNINNGGTLSLNGGNLGVGRGQTGNINIAAGGTLLASNVADFHIGWDGGGTGTITQTGGVFTKSGGGDLRIGAFGGSGSFDISGGIANTENLRISFAGSGTGTINQTGGTVNNTGELALGWASTGNATYNLSAGSLVSSQRIRFGIGSGVRDNIFNQTGGSVTVTDGRVDIGEEAGPNNTYDISGGTLTVNGDGRMLVGAFGTSSGTLNVSGNSSINLSNGIVLGDGGSAQGTVNLNGGTVNVNRIVSGGSSSTQYLNLNGGTIVAKSTEGNMISGTNLVATIQSGGVTINSNGFDIGVTVPLGGAGDLTKTGENQLKLLGTNTYSGDTVINEGLLTLIDGGSLSFVIGADGVNNQITGDGDGSFNLFGKLNFDLANAASQGMWNIIDLANLDAVNIGASFSVDGWNEVIPDSNVWTSISAGSIYSFDAGSGILTAVPETGSWTLALASLCAIATFRRRG